MKITAIRGRNLASLHGDFELNLEAPPLGGCGLFAITGPTGSGKTTLLDCMCLALFDAVPRFEQSNRFQTEENRQQGLSSADPRNILRLGTAEAFAEVDFKGVDRRTYRASWRVRRARNKPSGRIQSQTMTLSCLENGQELGDTRKTDTKKAIAEKLGLDYHQFCRAVLLAQGDFAAFIKANPKERAFLLERITGTQIYTTLSTAAFERHKEEVGALTQIEMERAALNLLSVETLAELTTVVATQAAQERVLAEKQERLQKAYAYFQGEAEMVTRLEEAQVRLTEAEKVLAETTSEHLPAILAAQKLRPALTQWDQARQNLAHHKGELTTRAERLRELGARRTLTEAAYQAAQAHHAELRALQEQRIPELNRARALDGSLRDKQALAKEEQRALSAQQTDQAEGRRQLASLNEQQETINARLAALDAWQNSHAHRREVADNWRFWEEHLSALPGLKDEMKQLETQGQTLRLELEAARATERDAAEQLQQAVEAEKEAQEAAGRLKREAAVLQNKRTDRELARLGERKLTLDKLAGCLKRNADLRERQLHLDQQLASMEQEQLENGERLQQLRKTRETLSIRLEEAGHALHLAEAAQDLSGRRAELLRDGAPCPLCGALEHPFHDEQDPLSAALSKQRERLSGLKTEERRAADAFAKAEANRNFLSERLEECSRESEVVGRQGVACHTEQDQLNAALEEPVHPLEPEGLGQAQRAVDEARGNLLQAQEAAVVARKAADRAADHQETTRRRLDEARKAQELHGGRLTQLERGLEAGDMRLADCRGQWEAGLARLQPLLIGSEERELFAASPKDFLASQREGVEQWQVHQQKREQQRAANEQLQQEISGLSERLRTQEEHLQPRLNGLAALERQLAELVAERSELLGGQATELVETRLKKDLSEAETRLELSRLAATELEKTFFALSESIEQLGKTIKPAENGVTTAHAELEEQLCAAGLDEATLRDYLAYDQNWCDQKQKALELAREDLAGVRVLRLEREEQLEKHRLKKPEGETAEDLAKALSSLEGALESTRAEKHRAQAQINQDRLNREKAGALEPRYQQQLAQTELWAEMNKLIGSHDGSRFRKFAQGLTLDVLLGAANDHLCDLEPRYTLRRVGGEDLELEVMDLDMGDEKRTLAGLSGGETFLVSLALALGLATINAEGHQIESLFIDEGFGVLDPHALDNALAVLEQLQASGRQVGIISHVVAVGERVDCRVQLVRKGNGSSSLKII